MRPLSIAISLVVFVSGCARSPIPGFDDSANNISPQQIAMVDARNTSLFPPDMKKDERNRYITEELFIVDQDYAAYEKALTKGEDSRKLFGSLATIGMSSAAAVIPLGEATKILNTTITAVQGAQTAVDQDLLQSQAIQSIERQMRTDRNNEAKIIFDRMGKCETGQYPIYIALSDLEAYKHAGTFESAIIGLGKTTSAVETASKDIKDSSSDVAQKATANILTGSLLPSAQTNGGNNFKCPIDSGAAD